MSHRRIRRFGSGLLAAGIGMAGGAVGVLSASAQSSPSDTVTAIPALTGVGTSVALNPSTASALKSLGVSVAPTGSASFDAATSTVTFPITSGYAEIHSNHNFKPGWIDGSIEHDGSGLSFTAGSTVVNVSDFVVDPGHSMLYATVGGKPDVPLLFLDGRNVAVSMQNGDVVLNGTVAKLTPTAASALDGAFKTTAIKAGTPLGTVHLVAKGTANTYPAADGTELARLTGVGTSVALNPGTAGALKSLGISVAPNGSGTFDAATSTVTFPITGGTAVIHANHNYKPGWIAGVVLHQGSGLTFSKGSTTVALTNFVVDPGDSMLTGTVGGKIGVPLLFLDGSKVAVSKQGSDVVLNGTVAKLTPTAASALNQAFATTAFKAGLPLGTVHLVASGD
jgi:hypothetical protein